MLWIALHFPQLPLETLLRGSRSPDAWAIVERDRVLAADAKARTRGVRPGMLVSAALAIAPQLHTRTRDGAAETESLLGIAGWVAQFTPSVALDFPDGLALEVEGSLKFFGGLEKIVEQLKSGLAAMGFSASLAAAPTARAAAWLARSAQPRFVVDAKHLQSAVERLAVPLLRCDREIPDALASLGVTTIGALLALPREGVARRFGQALLDELDRGLGRLADPRSFFTAPAAFHAAIELPAEVSHAEGLLFAGRRLLTQLEGFLAARCSGVQRFRFRLMHRDGPASDVDVGLVAPARDAAHFAMLLREQLGKRVLRDPVRSIVLEASEIVPLAGASASLLAEDRSAPGDWPRMIERLRARLGSDAVHSLATGTEHRPEKASRRAEPGTKSLPLEFGARPLWLLEEPRPLEEVQAAPHYRGRLTLLAGPERIETGWWDGEDVARDYFIARTGDDSLVWIYRARGAGWYLHGVFS
jgi:protein ImuB